MGDLLPIEEIALSLGLKKSFVKREIRRLKVPEIEEGLYSLRMFQQSRIADKNKKTPECTVCRQEHDIAVMKEGVCLRCRLGGSKEDAQDIVYRGEGMIKGTKI